LIFDGDEFLRDVEFEIDSRGYLSKITPECSPGSPFDFPIVIPGIPNCHSHSFQRAMAGLGEAHAGGNREDSFWSWRETMYSLAEKLDRTYFQSIAAYLYMEMLESGYTSVGEFHYLHRLLESGGTSREDSIQSSSALIEASVQTGINLCLIPVLYQLGGFQRKALEKQAPFLHENTRDFIHLIQNLKDLHPKQLIGAAIHSLRAVDKEQIQLLLKEITSLHLPIHIHISEQPAEVLNCQNHYGKRPVEFLLDNFAVDETWTLIHATHIDERELTGLVRSRANICLCPITEANLGDGIFPAGKFLLEGGKICIGSDSNILINPFEEMRLLEYSQRYQSLKRIRCTGTQANSPGQTIAKQVYSTGETSLQTRVGFLKAGYRADFLVLDSTEFDFLMQSDQSLWDFWIFAQPRGLVQEVYMAGKQVVKNGKHLQRASIQDQYKKTMAILCREGLLA